jgi:hypothetical protein
MGMYPSSELSPAYRSELQKSAHLLKPEKPTWLPLSTDPEKLHDDPTGECFESFRARLVLWFSTLEIARILRAYVFSRSGHREQFRKGTGERFFNHPRSVAISILDEFRIHDVDILCVALLHDIKEDAFLLDSTIIALVFGNEVMHAVNVLTKDASIAKGHYFTRMVSEGGWKALLVKLCDRIHNLRTLEGLPRHKRAEQVEETRREFPAVLDALRRVIPEEHRAVVRQLETLLFDLCDLQDRLLSLLETRG